MPQKRLALVVTTYNNPRLLELCLTSLAHQTDRDFALHIADDGSGPETKALIERLAPSFREPPIHHWHPDQGYRKAIINNIAFKALGDADVVICVDGDTIAHHRFIEDHRRAHVANDRVLFMGRRIDLGPRISASLSTPMIPEFQKGLSLPLLRSWWAGETKNLSRAIRVANPTLQKLFRRNTVKDLLGSNFSVSRPALWDVNGYNEDFQSYWGEDGELFVRLRNTGVRIFGLKSYAIQFHVHHKRLEPTKEHESLYDRLLADHQYKRCTRGIFKN